MKRPAPDWLLLVVLAALFVMVALALLVGYLHAWLGLVSWIGF